MMSTPVDAGLGGGGPLGDADTLVYFSVTGIFNTIADPLVSESSNHPAVEPISALVTFTSRLAHGRLLYASDGTAINLEPLPASIYNGVLSTLDSDHTPGIELVANAGLNLDGDLIYDVLFTPFTQVGFLAPFSFKAPTDSTPVCITDEALERLPYLPPSQTTWRPSPDDRPVQLVR
jgi:hypothetical protein